MPVATKDETTEEETPEDNSLQMHFDLNEEEEVEKVAPANEEKNVAKEDELLLSSHKVASVKKSAGQLRCQCNFSGNSSRTVMMMQPS